MISRAIAQAIATEAGITAHSDDFRDVWRPEVERIVAGFGLPVNVQAPDCLFALPFRRRQVAVVSVTGQRFRFLILDQALFNVIPDPFALESRFPPPWDKTGTLPTLEWPEETLPKRTIKQLDHILKHGDGPFLLGACQTLVDSGKIALVREMPATDLFREVWALLPDSIRRQTWPATYAYSLALGFGLVALPTMPEGEHVGYLKEDQTRDYPESRYERELQVAVETGDQQTIDRLFARRSTAETLRLALFIVLGAAVLSVAARVLMAW